MELAVRTQTLHLRCARIEANMKGIDAADFPIIPTAGGGLRDRRIDRDPRRDAHRTGAGLRKMIDQVAFAASTDESSPHPHRRRGQF